MLMIAVAVIIVLATIWIVSLLVIAKRPNPVVGRLRSGIEREGREPAREKDAA